jgi:hypothetical protein
MTGALVIDVEPSSITELRRVGFTTEQIERLVVLRAQYPFLEWVDTDNQWQRLLFLKWRFQHGDLRRP